jgi:hypothetical protein
VDFDKLAFSEMGIGMRITRLAKLLSFGFLFSSFLGCDLINSVFKSPAAEKAVTDVVAGNSTVVEGAEKMVGAELTKNESCPLPAGKFDLQSVSLQSSTGVYEIFVLGGPSCLKQPYKMNQAMLARMDAPDGKSKAQLEILAGSDPVIHLTENYKIELKSEDPIPGEQGVGAAANGEVSSGQSSSWMPFLAGAAGAAIAGMAVNSMFNKPKYYMPPPKAPGQAVVSGYGSVGTSYQNAANDYRSKYNAPPPGASGASSLRQPGVGSSSPNSGVVGKDNPSKQSGTVQKRSTRDAPGTKRRGFFKRRGR